MNLFDRLAAHLGPHGFGAIGPSFLHRKTWNTNRGVAYARVPAGFDARMAVAELKEAARGPMRHSWFNQLGLQLVFETDGGPPLAPVLDPLVDKFNNQSILVQSIFAIDGRSGQATQARTWGQAITGKYQEAIAHAIAEHAASLQTTR